MRITMKKLYASPAGSMDAGRTYDVPKELAKQLIASRSAVPVDEDPATTPAAKRTASRKASKRVVKGVDKSPPSGDGAGEDDSSPKGDGED